MIHRLLAVAVIAGTPALFVSSAQAGQFDAKPMNSGAPDMMMMQPAAQPAAGGDAATAPPMKPMKKHMNKKMMTKKTMAKKDGM